MDEDRRTRMGKAGREFVCRLLSRDAVLTQAAHQFSCLVGGDPAGNA